MRHSKDYDTLDLVTEFVKDKEYQKPIIRFAISDFKTEAGRTEQFLHEIEKDDIFEKFVFLTLGFIKTLVSLEQEEHKNTGELHRDKRRAHKTATPPLSADFRFNQANIDRIKSIANNCVTNFEKIIEATKNNEYKSILIRKLIKQEHLEQYFSKQALKEEAGKTALPKRKISFKIEEEKQGKEEPEPPALELTNPTLPHNNVIRHRSYSI